MNNVLLIGSGGRESAILEVLLKSPSLDLCFFTGFTSLQNKKLKPANIGVSFSETVSFCKSNSINFVIVGPEAPLCEGIVDELEAHGIMVYGPNKSASALESSKIFMKDVLSKAGVPTAKYGSFSFNEENNAINFIKTFEGKIVIKTDGLASGKGVYICEDETSAITVLKEFFQGKFGEASRKVVIEEFLDGREVSVFALCDGKKAIPFFHACDYKKIGEGDTGLNTGGMGSFAPSFLSDGDFTQIVEKYFNATLTELNRRGISYKGFLFGGLIITKDGAKFLEYNIRMGDPETQSIMPLLDCDLLQILIKSHKGNLTAADIKFKNSHAVTVILASNGYPLDFEKGHAITGTQDVSCSVFPAGVLEKNGKLFTNGGRVLAITATAQTQEQAREIVYRNIEKISFHGMYFRRDIAK